MSVQTQSKLLWGDNQVLLGEYLDIAKESPELSKTELEEAFLATVRANIFSDFLSSLEHVVPEDTKLSDLPSLDLKCALLDIEVNYYLDDLVYDMLHYPDATVKTMLDHVMDLLVNPLKEPLKGRPIMDYILSLKGRPIKDRTLFDGSIMGY